MGSSTYVGNEVTDVRSVNKVTGAMTYAADIFLPGMLHAVMIRSEHPHALVRDIDISEALKVEGVVSIVTYKDFPELQFGTYVHDQTAFTSHPRYIGDPIGAIAAETVGAAEEAARKVKIDYEVLPHILDPEESFRSKEVIIHPDMHTYKAYPTSFFNYIEGTNIPNRQCVRKGDVEKGFAESDFVIESRISVPPIYHGTIETHACVCKYDPDGKLTVYSTTQGPFLLRDMVSNAMGLPMHKVNIIQTAVGGGFGGKISGNIEIRAAALAKKCGNRPVKMVMTREEEWETIYTRSALIGYYKTGVNKDGKIIARKVTLFWDSGAYADYEVSVARSAGYMSAGPYDIPNVCIDSYAVYTNKIIATAYRGFGCSETTFCYEQDMDIIADKIGIDPIKFRLINAFDKGSINATGQVLKSCALKDCINEVANQAKPVDQPTKSTVKRGQGISCMHKFTVHTVPTSDIVKLNEDGTIILETSAVDIGQGSDTVMSQILADVLDVPIENIAVVPINTNYTSYGWQTAASSKTFFNGNSTMRAGLDLRRKILRSAARSLCLPESDLYIEEGIVRSRNDQGVGLPFSAIALGVYDDEGGLSEGPLLGYGVYTVEDGSFLCPLTGQGRKPSAFWMYAAMIADVEVDTETGCIKVLKLISANDVGKAINPKRVKEQIIGGAIQGLGSAIFEEVLFDDQGRIINANMHDYKMPTIGDIPEEVATSIIETQPQPDGPFGAKGVGEPAMACPAAAIANAVANALGVRIYNLPLSPEKILNAINKEG